MDSDPNKSVLFPDPYSHLKYPYIKPDPSLSTIFENALVLALLHHTLAEQQNDEGYQCKLLTYNQCPLNQNCVACLKYKKPLWYAVQAIRRLNLIQNTGLDSGSIRIITGDKFDLSITQGNIKVVDV